MVEELLFSKKLSGSEFQYIPGEHCLDSFEIIMSLSRTVFGLLLIFFIPGYAIMWALYTKKDDLNSIIRIALGFVLSIAVVILSNLTLDLIFGIDTTALNILILPILISSLSILIWGIRRYFQDL